MKRTSRKGFTLIELIVTIVILGILAALAVPAFQAVIERSRENAAVQGVNAAARELHALAAFDADFVAVPTGADANGHWDDVRTAAVNAGDLDAGNYTLADVDPDAIADNGDEFTTMSYEQNGYTAVANLGQSVGSFDASLTTVAPTP